MVAHITVRTYGINQVFSPTTALESSTSPRRRVASTKNNSSSSSIYYFHVKQKKSKLITLFLSVWERNSLSPDLSWRPCIYSQNRSRHVCESMWCLWIRPSRKTGSDSRAKTTGSIALIIISKKIINNEDANIITANLPKHVRSNPNHWSNWKLGWFVQNDMSISVAEADPEKIII